MRVLECKEQEAVIEWASYHPIARDHLIANANGGKRDPREAKNLKKQGVRPGVSDLFLAYPILPYRAGLWIELKRPVGFRSVLRLDQIAWIERMRQVGYEAVVAYGADAAIHAIEVYLRTKYDK